MSTPSLFPSQSKTLFMNTTLSRYRHMVERHERKGIPPPAFTLLELREHILEAMKDRYDGAIRCLYCGRVCDISEVELDHATPLSRGGWLDLENIDLPCATCNAAKGEATREEWTLFMEFLEKVIPLARPDILDRLAKYGKLVSAKRKSDMLLRNQGLFPKKAKKEKPPMVRAIEEVF